MPFVIDRVNLSIGKRVSEIVRGARFQSVLTVDFLPPSETGKQRARILAENTVVAMYFNNRAAESLAQGAVNDAYWWAREAILQDPSLARGYNTLGVVYRRHGDPKLALNALAHAHALEPDNPQVLSNLAQANIDQGRNAEAAVLLQRLAQIEAEPPFVYFDRGQEALRQGDVVTANAFFERQVDRAPYYHEFHYWLAITQARLGHPRQARKHVEMAMDTSTTRESAEITEALGGPDAVAQLTGSRCFERFSGPQIRKFWKDDAAAYARTSRIHLVSSFMASALIGGDAPVDPGDASGMNLMNLRTSDWDARALDATAPGLRERLPHITPSSTVIGVVLVHT